MKRRTKRNTERQRRVKHKWNRDGAWSGPGNVRTCLACGMAAYKEDTYAGYMTQMHGMVSKFHKKMPPCTGGKR